MARLGDYCETSGECAFVTDGAECVNKLCTCAASAESGTVSGQDVCAAEAVGSWSEEDESSAVDDETDIHGGETALTDTATSTTTLLTREAGAAHATTQTPSSMAAATTRGPEATSQTTLAISVATSTLSHRFDN
ncbi:uncharacterized protein LOC119097167 [Pollicipes pollicipes]|uniref:uncharacterized protein LOC119097167 n=1 Tax=Pollicipes pollicipes TaxID=41117 RepID=UPI001885777A|nr:uncharacterized protein LOC119097167 [Pollicipes pollicipes]